MGAGGVALEPVNAVAPCPARGSSSVASAHPEHRPTLNVIGKPIFPTWDGMAIANHMKTGDFLSDC